MLASVKYPLEKGKGDFRIGGGEPVDAAGSVARGNREKGGST